MDSRIGARILGARKAARLSQQDFAAAVNVSTRTVRAWEGGEYEPSADKLALIEKVLGVEITATEVVLSPELVERALREASDVAFAAEIARRLARARPRYDQGNVSPMGDRFVHGMPFESEKDDGA